MDWLRAFIVDDEPLARERLRGLLEAEPAVEVVDECADGAAALAAIQQAAPDVVFLDIQMPGLDGLQLAARLPVVSRPAIVFTTAHDRFALEAFSLAATDYLLKPFDGERLQQTLGRLREQRSARAAGPLPAEALPTRAPGRVAFRTDGRIVFLRSDEIIWAEADDNYVTLHLADGRLLLRETLTAVESRLGPVGFTRVNRSAIVQFDQIKELQPALHGDYTVVLRNGTKLPLSRSLRGQLERFAAGGA